MGNLPECVSSSRRSTERLRWVHGFARPAEHGRALRGAAERRDVLAHLAVILDVVIDELETDGYAR
jgi:hypothetical protein